MVDLLKIAAVRHAENPSLSKTTLGNAVPQEGELE